MRDIASTIRETRFSSVRLTQGYDMDEVDGFLDMLAATADAGQDLTPMIDTARFTTTSLRAGYDISDVDGFLASLVRQDPEAPEAEAASAPVPRAADDGVVQQVPGLFARLFGRH